MSKWHVNPATGQAGKCSAEYSCPFGGALGGHKTTKREASKLYEDYRDGLYSKDHSSYFYFISDEENEMFTEGDCGLLARELHKQNGYPVVAIGLRQTGQTTSWQHMVVRTPENRFLDVTGIQTESSLKGAWSYRFSVRPDEEIVFEELNENKIEEYLGKVEGQKAYPNSDPQATASRILRALSEKF